MCLLSNLASLQLKNTIEMIREQKLKKLETQVDVGCNFFL